MKCFYFRIVGFFIVLICTGIVASSHCMNAWAEENSSAIRGTAQRYLDSTSDLAIKVMPASGEEKTETKEAAKETSAKENLTSSSRDLNTDVQKESVQPPSAKPYGIDAILRTPERKVHSLQVTPTQSKNFYAEREVYKNPDTYKLGNGDRIKVIIYGEPDLSGELSINSDGLISMPLVGDILLAGKTASDAQEIITLALKGGYLKKPNVSVEVTSRRPFYIIGEVRKPGSYSYIDGMSVLKAIAVSGGFTYRADRETVEILRGGEANVKPFEANISSAVKPGDIVIVQERFF